MLLETDISLLLLFRGSKPLLEILVVPLIFPAGPQSGSQQPLHVQVPSGLCLEQHSLLFIPARCQNPAKTETSLSLLRLSHTCAITPNAQKHGVPLAVTSNAFPHACSLQFIATAHIAACGCPTHLKVSLPTLAAGNVLGCDCGRGEISNPVHFLSHTVHWEFFSLPPLSLIINQICCSCSNLAEELPLKRTRASCEITVIYG